MTNHLFDFIKRLVEYEIDFVICGGVACVLQGCDRTTFDIDINVPLKGENIHRLVELVKNIDLRPRNPEPLENILKEENRIRWLEQKNALVYTLTDSTGLLQINIFLRYPIPWQELKSGADSFEIDGIYFFVSSKRDLIYAKEQVFPLREKDRQDIQKLRELLNNEE